MASRFPLVYGTMYNAGSPINVTIANTANYYIIGATWTAGPLRGVTLTNCYGLTPSVTGYYLCQWAITGTCGTVAQDVYAQVYNNGAAEASTIQQYHWLSSVNYNMSGYGIFSVTGGNEVTIYVRNATGTNQLSFKYCEMSIYRVG